MTTMHLQRIATARRGAAALEMAIVAPVVLLFALAATDFGRVVHSYSVVSNASRCGAEYGAMHGFTSHTRSSWESEIRKTVIDEMAGLGSFQSSDLQIDIETSDDDDGLFRVAVTVTYPFSTAVAWQALPSVSSLRHRVEMRRLQ